MVVNEMVGGEAICSVRNFGKARVISGESDE